MCKMKKKVVCLVMICMLLMLPLSVTAKAENIDQFQQKLFSVEDYQKWLEIKSEESEDKTVLEQFNKLKWSDKQRFVNYITDPDVLKQIISVDLKPGESKSLYNEDITVSLNVNSDKIIPGNVEAAGLQSVQNVCEHTVVGDYDGHLLGIKVISFRLEMKYKHNESRILSLTDYKALTTRCWLPASIEYTNKNAHIENSVKRAYYECDVQFYYTFKELGLVVGAANAGIWGDCDCVFGSWYDFYD